MKIHSQKKNKNKKTIIITLVSFFIILTSFVIYIFIYNGPILDWRLHPDNTTGSPRENNSINYSKPTPKQSSDGYDTKKRTLDRNETVTDDEKLSKKKQVSMSITSSNQSITLYQLRVVIDALVGDGTCQLSLTKDSTSVQRNVSVVAQSSVSTCAGFDIPMHELSAGEWNMTVRMDSSTAQASLTKVITIQ